MGVKFKATGDSKLNDNPGLVTAFVRVWGELQKLCGIFKQILQQERELLCGRLL